MVPDKHSGYAMHAKTCFILDLDGTVYLGGIPITGTVDFVRRHWDDIHFHFLSNNTSKTPESYVQRLRALGIPVTPDRILSPLDPLTDHLRAAGIRAVYAVANAAFTACLRARMPELTVYGPDRPDQPEAAGFTGYDGPDGRKGTRGPGVEAVILAYDTELTYAKLARSALLLQRPDVAFFATHPDLVCPSEAGPLPDVGSFLALYETATGRRPDRIFGKPDPAVLAPLLDRYPKSEMVMVGDRLSTDKVLAENAGIDFILVLSGEATRADLPGLERQPTLVVDHLGQLERGKTCCAALA